MTQLQLSRPCLAGLLSSLAHHLAHCSSTQLQQEAPFPLGVGMQLGGAEEDGREIRGHLFPSPHTTQPGQSEWASPSSIPPLLQGRCPAFWMPDTDAESRDVPMQQDLSPCSLTEVPESPG